MDYSCTDYRNYIPLLSIVTDGHILLSIIISPEEPLFYDWYPNKYKNTKKENIEVLLFCRKLYFY